MIMDQVTVMDKIGVRKSKNPASGTIGANVLTELTVSMNIGVQSKNVENSVMVHTSVD